MWTMLWACADHPAAAPRDPLPVDGLRQLADRLVTDSGAPGALLGVIRGDQRWVGAAGSQDLSGARPMPADGVFRAGSLTKLYTGALVLQEVEAGRLSLSDRLDRFVPDFPGAAEITVDQLLSHTGGVTAAWLEDPELQALILGDLGREWSTDEVLATLATEPPAGPPGATGMVYSNTDFVLLGAIVSATAGEPFPALLADRLLAPLDLADTTYAYDDPEGLVSGWYAFGDTLLDITGVPQTSVLSFAGPSGAIHTTTDDLLTWADALFRGDAVLDRSSLDVMTTPAEPDAWYGHATMRFCPCPGGPTDYTGWGHGGYLPGYWSVVVYYPDQDVIVAAAVNRDSVDGVPLDVGVFDPTLAAALALVAP